MLNGAALLRTGTYCYYMSFMCPTAAATRQTAYSPFVAAVMAEVRAEMGRQRITAKAIAASAGHAPSWMTTRASGATETTLHDFELIAGALGLSPLTLLDRAFESTGGAAAQ